MPIKILFIITKLELGGAQKNVLDILSNLDTSVFEPVLISSDGLLADEARAILGERLKIVSYLKHAPNPLFDILAIFLFASYMKREHIEIVHTHSSKAGILGRWAARIAGVPTIIHTVHGWGFHDHLRGFLNNLYIFLERKTAIFTSKLIVVSESDMRKGLALKIGRQDQYVLIRCGIKEQSYKTEKDNIQAIKHSLRFSQNDPVIVMVACLKSQKNPIDFVECASYVKKYYPQVKFVLVGDGVLRQAVANKITDLGLSESVFLLGWRRDVRDILLLSDVFVLTSLWEGLPLALLEALAAGLPVAAYDICGISEVVKDGVNGFLSRPKDVKDLSAKICLYLSNEGLRKRMGAFGKYVVSDEAFSYKGMMKRLVQIYSRAT